MAGVHCSEETPTDLNVTGLTSTCNWFPAIVYTLERNEFDDNIAIIYAECLFIRPLHINNTCCMTSLSAVFRNYCYCEERGNRINIPNKWVRSIIPTVHNSDSPLLRHFGLALFRQPITPTAHYCEKSMQLLHIWLLQYKVAQVCLVALVQFRTGQSHPVKRK